MRFSPSTGEPKGRHPRPRSLRESGTELGSDVDTYTRTALEINPPRTVNSARVCPPQVNPGETPEAALVRELKEELDIIVEQGQLRPLSFVSFPYPTFHMLMPLYGESPQEWV